MALDLADDCQAMDGFSVAARGDRAVLQQGPLKGRLLAFLRLSRLLQSVQCQAAQLFLFFLLMAASSFTKE